MAVADWESIKKQYLNEYAETGVGVKAFCVRNDLNYSTAKKHLNNKALVLSGQNRTQEQNKGQNRT